jgi:beta-lactamase superfamily II metal-dependent hydrolase
MRGVRGRIATDGRAAMAWTLNIHTIDVGQGDCSLIHAVDGTTNTARSLLIDGGHGNCTELIRHYLWGQGLAGVDVMLITHYEADHMTGIVNLLLADNLWHLADTFAGVALPEANGKGRPQRLAATAAAIAAAARGAVGISAGDAAKPAKAARSGVSDTTADARAIEIGINKAKLGAQQYGYGIGTVLPTQSTRISAVAKVGALAAVKAIEKGRTAARIRAAISDAVRVKLYGLVDKNSQFDTEGAYGSVVVVDNGGTLEPGGYADIVAGRINDGDHLIRNLGTGRTRVTASLGREVLFNADPDPGHQLLPPAQAPTATVVAAGARAWQGVGRQPAAILSTQPGNDQSISLAIRFGAFSFLTSGDQLFPGEQLIADAVTRWPLPNPNGGTYPQIQTLSYTKCSHHGGETSTRGPYLARARPKGVAISAGKNPKFEHPSEQVVTRLHDNADVKVFYMTNCNFVSPEIPATNAQDQIGAGAPNGNKSRVCGDNNNGNNLLPGRRRGNIHLSIDEAQAHPNQHRFSVSYLEEGLIPPGPYSETWTF